MINHQGVSQTELPQRIYCSGKDLNKDCDKPRATGDCEKEWRGWHQERFVEMSQKGRKSS